MTGQALRFGFADQASATVVTADGELDLSTYPEFRDGLLKTATDAGDGLIVDITGLAIDDPSLTSVFSLVALRISDWPGIPFAVVAGQSGRDLLRRMTADRFVAVCPDVERARSTLRRPVRQRVERTFSRDTTTSAHARAFVADMFDQWAIAELTADAWLVVTELVENVLTHTDSVPRLRLDLRRGICRIAVVDDDPHPVAVRERLGPLEPGLGLLVVAQIATTWGCSRSWRGGKVVWAVLSR